METTQARQRTLVLTVTVILCGYLAIRHHHQYVVPLKYAIRSMNAGKPDDALRAARASLQEKADSVLANMLAAGAYLKKGDYVNAEPALRRALAVDPDDDKANYLLWGLKLQTGHCEEAHDIAYGLMGRKIEKYHGIIPSNEMDYDWLKISNFPCDLAGFGDRALSEGKIDFAISLYSTALKNEPDNRRAKAGLEKAYAAKALTRGANGKMP